MFPVEAVSSTSDQTREGAAFHLVSTAFLQVHLWGPDLCDANVLKAVLGRPLAALLSSQTIPVNLNFRALSTRILARLLSGDET